MRGILFSIAGCLVAAQEKPSKDWRNKVFSKKLESNEISNKKAAGELSDAAYKIAKKLERKEKLDKLLGNTRITGGTKAKSKYPFMVKMEVEFRSGGIGACGAAILSNDWIITAAHCVAKEDNPVAVILTYSELRWREKNKYKTTGHCRERVVFGTGLKRTLFRHKDYDPDAMKHDIALIKVKEVKTCFETSPMNLTYPNANFQRRFLRLSNAEVGKNGTESEAYQVAGWGAYNPDKTHIGSQEILHAKVPFVENNECNREARFPAPLTQRNIQSGNFWSWDKTFCAGGSYSKGQDSCQGDSGGPAFGKNQNACITYKHKNRDRKVCPYQIYGIVSFGGECGGTVPGVYTNIKNYCSWIATTTRNARKPLLNNKCQNYGVPCSDDCAAKKLIWKAAAGSDKYFQKLSKSSDWVVNI